MGKFNRIGNFNIGDIQRGGEHDGEEEIQEAAAREEITEKSKHSATVKEHYPGMRREGRTGWR